MQLLTPSHDVSEEEARDPELPTTGPSCPRSTAGGQPSWASRSDLLDATFTVVYSSSDRFQTRLQNQTV